MCCDNEKCFWQEGLGEQPLWQENTGTIDTTMEGKKLQQETIARVLTLELANGNMLNDASIYVIHHRNSVIMMARCLARRRTISSEGPLSICARQHASPK
jgi:hypothetical protein